MDTGGDGMVQSEVLIQIGRRLYDQRKKMELTQEEMAEILGAMLLRQLNFAPGPA